MTKNIIKIKIAVLAIIMLVILTPSPSVASANNSIELVKVEKINEQAVQIAASTNINLTKEEIEVKKEEPKENTGKKASAPTKATTEIWEKLAFCESGGKWATNSGNGYYGGLQFSAQTWKAAGGTQYAPLPHLATKEQQIAVADAWLARTSWGQWPACTSKLGLR